MTRAYQEIYLSKAQSVLGDAFDYAINTCDIPGNDFVKMFIASSVSKRMANGEPSYLAGKSGIEIVVEIIEETKGQEIQIEVQEHFGRSKEYWIGWAVAYYQWHSSRKYNERQEYQAAKQGVEKKHRNDGIVLQGLLLEHIIESQQSCRKKSKG